MSRGERAERAERGGRGGRNSKALLVLFILGSLTLMTLDTALNRRGPVGALREAAALALGPLVGAGDPTVRTSGETKLRLENTLLRADNVVLRGERAARAALWERYEEYDEFRMLPARVIDHGPAHSYRRTIAVNLGSRDGVVENSTVVSAAGLVGRVTRVGAETATVLLVCDPESVVGVRLEGNPQLGLVRGNGQSGPRSSLTLRLFDSTSAIEPGDRLLSWGSPQDRPYLPGLPVGVVTSVTTGPDRLGATARVRSAVDFTALSWVGVVRRGG